MLLLTSIGCSDGGNQVIESAPDPSAMGIAPGATEDIEESSKAMENALNPLAD
ncbi:hypothetical protein [Rhodopirellula sallentina]|uniref:Uncharacterized protein n=1 Tax=Rhodopirellula sallentina SM41 TaxID=1263870 RepID=M5TU07_9BACT|nr:hypothetical protein [Rhodopirellula sallentina]EMI52645.1 hypothetical protein RSSM_05915 [Rhodopirellula sallentina SM41]